MALIEFGIEQDLITLVGASPKTVAAAQKVIERIQAKAEPTASRTCRRRQREGECTPA